MAATSIAVANPYQSEIAAAAARFGLSPQLLHAVVKVESNYDSNARSHAGAVGLMQLMPKTAKRFQVTDRKDPVQSLHGGAHYLSWLLRRYQGDIKLALAGYNAGEGSVDKYNGIPPYRETRRYVAKVLNELERRHKALSLPAASQDLVHFTSGRIGSSGQVVRVTALQAGIVNADENASLARQVVQNNHVPTGYTVRYATLTETQTQATPVASSLFGVN